MQSWSLDWLKQRPGLDAELAQKAQQRKLGGHLVHLFRQAISTNVLLSGDRLPSTKDLMAELGISRNTAAYVYEQLSAEGYVYSRVGSGTFVSKVTPAMVHKALTVNNQPSPSSLPLANLSLQLSDTCQQVLKSAGAVKNQWGAFAPGVPDVKAFQKAAYAKIINRLWRHAKPEHLTYATAESSEKLQQALCDYLRIGRGVVCDPGQILVTDGTHQSIDLAIRALLNPSDKVWVEEPCYWGINNILKINHISDIERNEVDTQGMVIDEKKSPPKIIFTTPSHQYPLGYVMSLERRQSLLEFAKKNRCWIIEDDYDSEYRFGGRQIPSMQGMEKDSPVIYLGTFSKSLFPGMRIGYMVLPKILVDSFSKLQLEIYRKGRVIEYMALGEFIQQGHYTKHIRKMRVAYSRRRDLLVKLINKYMGSDYLFAHEHNVGLHLVLNVPPEFDDVTLCSRLASEGIYSKPLSRYFYNANKRNGLIIGYASLEEDEIQMNFYKMFSILKAAGIFNKNGSAILNPPAFPG